MKHIVILGAGYGGIVAALELEKKLKKRSDIKITVIDRREYHLYSANLYEVASAGEEITSVDQLKKSIGIPLAEIFAGKKVTFIKAEVTEINQAQRTVIASKQSISYDYLIVATGAVSEYFGVPGAETFSLPLKTLPDALAIRNQIAFAVDSERLNTTKKNVHIVVAGGGYTGVEFAAELSHEVRFLAWKDQYPEEKIEITVIEATNQLIPGFSDRLSQDALWHLKNRGVRVLLTSPISQVDEHFISLQSGEKIAYDVLVWSAGVKAAGLPLTDTVGTDRKGRVITNQFLQFEKSENIFAIGDSACVTNEDGKPAPPTAQDAIEQGLYLGAVLPQLMQNLKPKPYAGKKHGFIVTLGGRWAILNYGGFYFKGWVAYIIRECAQLEYYARILGWGKAFKYTWFDYQIYGRND